MAARKKTATTATPPAGSPAATSVSALVGMPVVDAAGKSCGRVHEFAVDVPRDGSHVRALILRRRQNGKRHELSLLIENIESPAPYAKKLRAKAAPTPAGEIGDFLLLERDLLDQQIIDVDGHKVVRVNDVNLLWELPADSGMPLALRIAEVEVGMRGASRRLLKGLPNAAVNGVSDRFKQRAIPWEFVDLIVRDPARRVRLKIEQKRLSKLHPSDIAAILEELAPAEREAIFSSLPEETAAETLEEVGPKVQKELVEKLDSDRAADIIEEMDPAAAADLLAELSDEHSEAILEEMEPEERQDVEELLEHEETSAAGRMTTDFVSVLVSATVADTVDALRAFEGDPDTITEIYLLDEEDKLKGVVPLARLLMAGHTTPLASLSEGHNVSCNVNARDREVAELFDKYNLRSLPVVDAHGKVVGAIHAEQVIAQLLEA
jgi:CBS domain-containing protein/sporulation protein YlmC with PRC-barrel domain